ncbi:DUF4157 domain-containing protein [Pasteurella skyensis]|uniref:DUF4157 domain-containing protein n=1 Tax=Phocoenobacter skyensis TaxID=97481 RepID=A0AAJ6P072_9PAST|nr:DUF4157 domain-containing protein [Pasteurella skyensis]MDP8162312.1 DUF4157 domain-containing protein [Pasteurella skyensis]MDP8172354.1 DUF4157 domain-containing protein [Pasteurella skyensis]MDP8177014.1 DUF4157 domain-containing protein [Pasteurella skyensis]MDP8178609.1 DUF4157 domain-containing protein [Pasteurella skyensis]MDP8182611.1 DUF4157 domain-containing protein [Pasteurella skyensis]
MKNCIRTIFILCLFIPYYSKANSEWVDNITFASKSEASTLLKKEDEYTKRLSKFDIQSRLHNLTGTKQQLVNLTVSEVKDWTSAEVQRVKKINNEINELIKQKAFHFTLPNIVFIKSSMQTEGGADGYTRGNLIVLKDELVSKENQELKHLIVHELFHILTRYNPNLRAELYSIIGFHLMNDISLPSPLKDNLISNPDAPFDDSYIKLNVAGQEIDGLMILFTNKPYQKGTFFDYVNIGFVRLKGKEKNKEVDLSDKNQPIVYSLDEVSGFFEQIGFNTQYIIDPEEILAENFVYAMTNKTELPTPEIIDRVAKILQNNPTKK